MPLINFTDLGQLGIIGDLPPYNLPPAAWSSGNNVRTTKTGISKQAGDVSVLGTPSVAPHWLLFWNTGSEIRWIYAGTTQVHYAVGTSQTNITRYTTVVGDDDYTSVSRPIWSGGILHGVPILNTDNSTDYPQQWDGVLNRLKDLDNWPASTYAKIIRTYKNSLIALGITVGGVEYPYIVKWSHPADPGTVPTSWDETDATKLAGEKTIAQSGGELVDCLPLGDVNILYKTDAIWGMQLSGSLAVYRFFEILSTQGLLAPNCAVSYKRGHFVVGADDIYLFDGLNAIPIANNRVREAFFGGLSTVYYNKTFVVSNKQKREIWVYYVGSGDVTGYCDKVLVWNWEQDTWTFRAADNIASAAYGEIPNIETFDSASGTIDSDTGTIDSAGGVSPAALQLLQARPSTAALLQGDKEFLINGAAYSSYVERRGLAIVGQDRRGQPVVDQVAVKFIRSLYAKVSAPVPVTLNISVGSQDDPEGPLTWEGPYTFDSSVDTKVDFTVSGKFIAVRFESSDSLSWFLTSYQLDLTVLSRE